MWSHTNSFKQTIPLPRNPNKKDIHLARFIPWWEIKPGAIPRSYGREHFVSSQTVLIENPDEQKPTADTPTLMFIRLPTEIAQTRSLLQTDQETLLRELYSTLNDMELSPPGDDKLYDDQIYLRLLDLPPTEQEEETRTQRQEQPPTLHTETTARARTTHNEYQEIPEEHTDLRALAITYPKNPENIHNELIKLLEQASLQVPLTIDNKPPQDEGAWILTQERQATMVYFTDTSHIYSLLTQSYTVQTAIREGLILQEFHLTLPDANLTFLGKLHPAIYHVLYQIVQQGIGTTTPEPQPSYNPYLTDPRTAKGNTYTRDFPTLNHLLDHKEEGFQQRTKKTKQTKRNHVLPRQPSPQTDSTDDEKENQTTLNTRFEYMTPRALSDPNIPDSFHVFWNLKAKDAQKRTRFPAPRFSPSIEHAEKELSFPDIAERDMAPDQDRNATGPQSSFSVTSVHCYGSGYAYVYDYVYVYLL